jgi:DNA repair protein RecO (recombination protein O)
MPSVSTPAILLKRVAYGDFDLIPTFFSLNRGKISLMAKSAVKSKKRFGGILEPFSALQIVYTTPRGKGLPILQEASLIHPFSNIRQDMARTAHGSYMAELLYDWTEEGQGHEPLYDLFLYILGELDKPEAMAGELSILFQMRFMSISGFQPGLSACVGCGTPTDRMVQKVFAMDLKKGGLLCDQCRRSGAGSTLPLSRGTLKQLQWMVDGTLEKASRIRLTPMALEEGTHFLEAFVPFHLGKEPRSLKFLQDLRRGR